jgi:hypothetical protein
MVCNQRLAMRCDWCDMRDGYHSFQCPQLEYNRLVALGKDAERIERFKMDEARLAELEHRAGCMEPESEHEQRE